MSLREIEPEITCQNCGTKYQDREGGGEPGDRYPLQRFSGHDLGDCVRVLVAKNEKLRAGVLEAICAFLCSSDPDTIAEFPSQYAEPSAATHWGKQAAAAIEKKFGT